VQPRVIFFDMGQTLVTGAGQSPRRLMASRLDLSEEETRNVGRLMMTHPALDPSSLVLALKRILTGHEQNHLQAAVEEVWGEQLRCVKEIDGATSVLRVLKARGLKLGLLSTTWHPLYSGFCESCPEMAELVDYFVLSYRLGCKKPSPEVFRKALAQAGAAAERCWMVGDSYELDVEPAMAVGMHTIWVLRGPEREKPLLAQVLRGEKPRPDWSVAHLEEILEYFLREGSL
jgi:HAD superfamily hydrolase (TIGR01549 family)